MSMLQILWLSILQGLTEFLPVSSSGHLILFSKFTDFPDQGIMIDIALHIGSIVAVCIYFYREIWEMMKGLYYGKLLPCFKFEGNKLVYQIIVATIPALIFGAILKFCGTEWLRNPKIIGWTILGGGLLLYAADKMSMTIKKVNNLSLKDAVLIGLAQCLALIPGTSRSGITITMGRFLGLERREAAKFSMLLAIPTILAAGILQAIELYASGDYSGVSFAINAVWYSFIVSLIAIYGMMWWLKKSTFLPFVIYRIILGTYLILDSYKIIDINM